MSKGYKILIWIGITAWFVVMMGFVSGEADKVICNRIQFELTDTVNNRFISGSDIRSMLKNMQMNLQGYPLEEINTRKLERQLEQIPYIKNTEVSTDITGELEIAIQQRIPLLRIMPEGRGGYYLDTEGYILPLSDQFSPLILLATGYIPNPDQQGGPVLEPILQGLHAFAVYLSEHPLWSDQIVQIYVDKKGEYELIPRVGSHHILFGSMSDWERKLGNLELLYRQGLSSYGWNTYEKINLKYTNQVICTKR